MDKPQSMSIKDYLIRLLAIKMLTSEKTIEAVVNHQFNSANEALKQNYSVELAGFGKFYFNYKKAAKRLAAYTNNLKDLNEAILDPSITEAKRSKLEEKIYNVTQAILELKPRVDEFQANL
jgi:nucleoid DNA-binding protein